MVLLFAITTSAMASQNLKPDFTNLVAPPQLINYQGSAHAVFDMGGIQYLFKVTQQPTSYPQCDVIQEKEKELMVVTHSPNGYAFFVEREPVAFKTDHNASWDEIVKRTHEKD